MISGNGGDGIDLIAVTSTGSGNLVAGNFVGVGTGGTAAIANSGSGLVDKQRPQRDHRWNFGRGGEHLLRQQGRGDLDLGSFRRRASSSSATTSARSWATPRPLRATPLSGIIDSSPSLTLGLTAASSTNVISGNGGAGVSLGATAVGSALFSNIIGLNGQGLVKLPNAGDGVDVPGQEREHRGGLWVRQLPEPDLRKHRRRASSWRWVPITL